MKLYSVKMRASEVVDEKGNDISSCYEKYSYNPGVEKKTRHISGAEKIVREENLEGCIAGLVKRAMNHPKGTAESINIKIEHVKEDEITYLEPLKVRTIEVKTKEEGWTNLKELLKILGIGNGQEVLNSMKETYAMRGTMVLDYKTMTRLEANIERGIRATNMDFEAMSIEGLDKIDELDKEEDLNKNDKLGKIEGLNKNDKSGKIEGLNKNLGSNNHFKEALVLATKVVSHPNILAEICISDDPNYTTGYIASKEFGYVRITNLKELGDENGGRIFLYNGKSEEVESCIDYIEKKHVLVRNNINMEY